MKVAVAAPAVVVDEARVRPVGTFRALVSA
jgi:hypothetical protein